MINFIYFFMNVIFINTFQYYSRKKGLDLIDDNNK